MPALVHLRVRLIFRGLIAPIVFALALLKRAYVRIQHLSNTDDTVPGSRSNPVSSSLSNRPAENDASQDMTTTALAIENVQDTILIHESPEENNENKIRNEKPTEANDKSFPQVAGNSNENQSRSAHSSSYILVNTNDENMQEGNQNHTDEMIVAALAYVLECCDMCVIL